MLRLHALRNSLYCHGIWKITWGRAPTSTLHTARSYIIWRTHFFGHGRFVRSHQKCPSHKMAPPVIKRSLVGSDDPRNSKKVRGLRHHNSAFSLESAEELDMDHVHLPFHYFLWGMTFIWPALVFQALRGLITLRVRVSHQRWIKPRPFEPAKICHDLCLYDYGYVFYRFQ